MNISRSSYTSALYAIVWPFFFVAWEKSYFEYSKITRRKEYFTFSTSLMVSF